MTPSPSIPPRTSSPAEEDILQQAPPIYLPISPAPLEDFFSFIKKFGPKEFENVIRSGQLTPYPADTYVYFQGEPSDSFYVINDGTVEIIVAGQEGDNPVPITYLSKGDLFGEIGILNDVPRTGSVRVPESATLLKFDRESFHRLLATVPAFGQYLSMLLARRLHKTTLQLHFYSNARELSGSLDFFDLPTIFQTISLSQQHGVMHIFNLTSEVLGEFAFARGTPISARFGNLYGMEALFQLFLATPKASFGFTRTLEPPIVECSLEISNVNEFTMKAVHMRDEMMVFEEKLKLQEDQPVKRVHARLSWPYPDRAEEAKALWQELVKEPLPVRTLAERVPVCRYTLFLILSRLFESGQLDFADITPYGYR